MFEDATFDSTGIKGGQLGRWLLLALGVNVTVVVGVVVTPLLWPQGLPAYVTLRELAVPAPGRVVEVQRQANQPVSTAASPQAMVFRQVTLAVPTTPSTHIDPAGGPPNMGEISIGGDTGVGSGATQGNGLAPVFAQPKPVVVAAQPGRFKVSDGVTDGLLIWKVAPVYPVIARAGGISGTVVLSANISKEGRIEELRVVSGNAMLTGAAITAVQQWKYRPYLLSGQPVAVETTVRVVFSLGRD
jgi:periplasmic protein TonB